jgi:hypothetical protein
MPRSSLLPLLLLLLLGAPASAGRNSGADGDFSERSSKHFRLLQDVDIDRYTGVGGTRQFERNVLRVLETAYDDVGDSVSIRPRAKVAVLIYDPGAFDGRFQSRFGFRAAGFFDGAIHVRGGTRVDGRLVAVLYHEYVHAALAWLNEGLAEYFEARAVGKRYLSAQEAAGLRHASRSGQWIPLRALSMSSFSHMGADSASLAYLQSYATVDHLVRRHGMRDMQALCERLVRSRNIDVALRRTYDRSLAEIEADLRAELG